MAYYAICDREAGLVGLAVTNAGMNLTPTGGTGKFGNNPFAMSIGAGRWWLTGSASAGTARPNLARELVAERGGGDRPSRHPRRPDQPPADTSSRSVTPSRSAVAFSSFAVNAVSGTPSDW